MMEESNKQILTRIQRLEKLSNIVCSTLSRASTSMEDEDSAEYLFKKLRSYFSTINSNDLHTVDGYLDALSQLVELAQMFREVPMLQEMHEQIRDSYEVMLFNKDTLSTALRQIRLEEQHQGLIENYWKN